MKQRFHLYRRNGGIYYLHDSETGKQTSLGTRDRAEATALFVARTQAHRQAHLNLQLQEINGHAVLKTGVGDRWYFRDFVDSPDERFRKIVKRFAEAGYVEAERDEFVAA